MADQWRFDTGYWRPSAIMSICSSCGKWTKGPFKGRRDVPHEELDAELEKRTGSPAQGGFHPAKHEPEHEVYSPAMMPPFGNGTVDEPVSGSTCTDCALRNSDYTGARRERIRQALQRIEDAEPGPEEGEPK